MNWELGIDTDVGEFVTSSVLSRHNETLKRQMDQHYSPRTDQCYSGQMDELCVTTQLYLENKGEYILEA